MNDKMWAAAMTLALAACGGLDPTASSNHDPDEDFLNGENIEETTQEIIAGAPAGPRPRSLNAGAIGDTG